MADEILTPEEVASELKVGVDTVVAWLRTGQLKGAKIGRQWRMMRADLDAFLKMHWIAGRGAD